MRSNLRCRHGRWAQRCLLAEPLENRSLLAFAAIAVNLYQDAGGMPGARIPDDVVQVGKPFYAEITAEESYPGRGGFASVRLNIAWDPVLLNETDSPFDISSIVTTDLPFLQTGTLDSASGTIQDLGGSAFVGMG